MDLFVQERHELDGTLHQGQTDDGHRTDLVPQGRDELT